MSRTLPKIVKFATEYTKKYKEKLAEFNESNQSLSSFQKRYTFLLCLDDHLKIMLGSDLTKLFSGSLRHIANQTGQYLEDYKYSRNFFNWYAFELEDELGRRINNMMLKIIHLIAQFEV